MIHEAPSHRGMLRIRTTEGKEPPEMEEARRELEKQIKNGVEYLGGSEMREDEKEEEK